MYIVATASKNLVNMKKQQKHIDWGPTDPHPLSIQRVNKLNKFHPTIKSTCDYSRERVHFLDVQVILQNSELSTDLYVKEADSQHEFHPSLCHPYHCVKSIPYSQALRLNGVCSNNMFSDNRHNQLEKWLSDINYQQKLVREQIFKARVVSMETLLNN